MYITKVFSQKSGRKKDQFMGQKMQMYLLQQRHGWKEN